MLATLTALALLTSCSPSSGPSPAAATAALTAHYDELPPSICLRLEPLPASFSLGEGTADLDSLGRYEALAAVGLLSETRTVTSDDDGNPKRGHVVVAFALSPSRRGEAGSGGSSTEFCYARAGIARVEGVAPASFVGTGTFRVRYAYRPTDVAKWATTGAVASAFPDIPRLLVSSKLPEASSLVRRTENGWSYAGE